MALFVYPPVSLSISGGASEATLLQVEQNTLDTVTELQTLNSNVAKEAKQDTQITEAQSTNAKLDTLNATDFATEAKQDSQITELQSINSELDAQTALLTTIDADTSAISASISAINNKLAASFFTLPYDQIQVTAKTADGPTTILSKLATVTQQTLTITYDVDGDFENAVVS